MIKKAGSVHVFSNMEDIQTMSVLFCSSLLQATLKYAQFDAVHNCITLILGLSLVREASHTLVIRGLPKPMLEGDYRDVK
jgi:hypothetical protein